MSKGDFVQGSSSGRTKSRTVPVEPKYSQEDEADKLWKALGIVAERKTKYKIRWEGDDPETGKPWPNSWTGKDDVTEDLIEEWLALPEEERRRRTEEEERFEKEEKKKKTKAKPKKSPGSVRRASSKSTTRSRRGSTVSTAASANQRAIPAAASLSDYKVKQEPVSVSLPFQARKRSNQNYPSGGPPAAKKRKTTHALTEAGDEAQRLKKSNKANSTGTVPTRSTRDPSPYSEDDGPSRKSKPLQKETKTRHREPSLALSPDAIDRLELFDAEMKLLEDGTEFSEHTPAPQIVYAESDVDSQAAGIMYPEAQPRWKGKQQQRNTETEDEVPETQTPRTEAMQLTPSRQSIISKMKPRTPSSQAGGSQRSILEEEFDIRPGELLGQAPLPEPRTIVPPAANTTKAKNIFPKKPTTTMSKPKGVLPEAKRKLLGPIPVMSPSKFTPHLPSSLPHSIIENPDGSQQPHPSSAESIEQFDSPDKSSRAQARVIIPKEASKGKSRADRSPFWSDHGILVRGQELAEKAKPAKVKPTRLTIQEIQERVRSASASRSSVEDPMEEEDAIGEEVGDEHDAENEVVAVEEQDHEEEEFQLPTPDSQEREYEAMEESQAEMMPGSSPPPPGVNQTQQEFEALDEDDEGLEYVDEVQAPIFELEYSFDDQQAQGATLDTMTQQDGESATMDPPKGPVLAIPEEEEESTQDLLAELEVQRAFSQPASPSPSPEPQLMPPPPPAAAEANEELQTSQDPLADQDVNVSMVPQPGTQPSQAFTSLLTPPDGHGRPRSRSKSPHVQSQQPGATQDDSQEIPATSSATNHDSQDTTNAGPTPSQLEQELKRALTLLNVKSEEIARLEELLKEEKLRVQVLTSRNDVLSAQEDDLKQRHSSDLERVNLAHEAERTRWSEERYQLEVAVKSAGERKALAERDCERFRDEYMQASGTIGQLRVEKRDLERELGIAQSQAKDGVQAIRSLFEVRLADLTKQRDGWQRMAEFTIEKDRRTNDELRKRAAEEPELRVRYQKYRERNRKLEVELQEVTDERDKVKEELENEKVESDRLRQALRMYESEQAGLHRSPPIRRTDSNAASTLTVNRIVLHENDQSKPPSGQASSTEAAEGEDYDEDEDDEDEDGSSSDFSDDAQVFRCQWRPNATNGAFCNRLFATQEDLRNHMLSDLDHLPISPDIDGLD